MLHIGPARDSKAAKARGRGVVGVAFELGTELKQFVTAETCPRDFVQGMKHAKPHRNTAPQSTTNWNIATNDAGKVERLALSDGKKLSRRVSNHPIATTTAARFDIYLIVK